MTIVVRVLISHQPHGNQARLSALPQSRQPKIWGKLRVSFDYWGTAAAVSSIGSYNLPLSHARNVPLYSPSTSHPAISSPLFRCLYQRDRLTSRTELIMSTEKEATEVHHGISNADHLDNHDGQYPVVAEGTGKTLDEAHGAKAKEVHNVSPALSAP